MLQKIFQKGASFHERIFEAGKGGLSAFFCFVYCAWNYFCEAQSVNGPLAVLNEYYSEARTGIMSNEDDIARINRIICPL